jgi:hypothetical protein
MISAVPLAIAPVVPLAIAAAVPLVTLRSAGMPGDLGAMPHPMLTVRLGSTPSRRVEVPPARPLIGREVRVEGMSSWRICMGCTGREEQRQRSTEAHCGVRETTAKRVGRLRA